MSTGRLLVGLRVWTPCVHRDSRPIEMGFWGGTGAKMGSPDSTTRLCRGTLWRIRIKPRFYFSGVKPLIFYGLLSEVALGWDFFGILILENLLGLFKFLTDSGYLAFYNFLFSEFFWRFLKIPGIF